MSNLFASFADFFPADRESVFLYDENLPGGQLSYAEMETLSGQLANYFVSIGVKRGDRLAVQVEKSAMALMVYLASLRAGFTYLPLNTAYTEAEMRYFIEDAEPSLLICAPEKQAKLAAVAAALGASLKIETLGNNFEGSLSEAIKHCDVDFTTVDCSDDELAAILYTSGTTGRPKGAMLSHENLRANAFTLKALWGWRPDDVLLHALPIFHVHGLFVACHCVLASGASMIFQAGFKAEAIMAALPQSTVMMGVPTFYTRLLANRQFQSQQCANMRLFISGSAPLLASTHKEFEQRTGLKILERYGMTETGMLVSNPLLGERRAGTVGQPLPGVELRVVDDARQPLSAGQVGSIQVKGANIFKGYWRKPEKTAEEFTDDGYFVTGDQGSWSDDGYLSIVGRAKDMIITGGFNVYPKEVELVLDAIDGVKESAVIGLVDADFGEAVSAVIVADTSASLTESAIITAAKQRLGSFKVPKQIFFLEELPRNTMGKVQKNQLREQFSIAR